MALHQLAIAKASFSASILRPDPVAVSKDDLVHFHATLEQTISKCSPINIQSCKRWILANILSASARTTAFLRFITALSASYDSPTKDGRTKLYSRPSPHRRRLHTLYIVSDVLNHAQKRSGPWPPFRVVAGTVQEVLPDLFRATASAGASPKIVHKLHELLSVWENQQFYSKQSIDELHDVVRTAATSDLLSAKPTETEADDSGSRGTGVGTRETPFLVPPTHGDQATPYYDLPAGNMMPHIVPNTSTSINPHLMKPLQLAAGPAEASLVTAMRVFLDEASRIFDDDTDTEDLRATDIDELGQGRRIGHSHARFAVKESYYGWSKTFCQKMLRRRRGFDMSSGANDSKREGQDDFGSSMKRRRYSRSDGNWSKASSLRSRSNSSSSGGPGRHSVDDDCRPSAQGLLPLNDSRSNNRRSVGRFRRRRSTSRSRCRSISPGVEQRTISQVGAQDTRGLQQGLDKGPFPIDSEAAYRPTMGIPGSLERAHGYGQAVEVTLAPPLFPAGIHPPPPPPPPVLLNHHFGGPPHPPFPPPGFPGQALPHGVTIPVFPPNFPTFPGMPFHEAQAYDPSSRSEKSFPVNDEYQSTVHPRYARPHS